MEDMGFSNLGLVNLSIVYFFYGLFSLLGAKISRTFGTKMTLFASAATYAIWIAAFLVPAYRYESKETTGIFSDGVIITLNIITAALLGVGAGPLWVCQAAYLSECACPQTKGRYNGIFFSIFNGASVVAYAMAGIMIRNLKKSDFYWILTAISIVGSFFFLFLTTPVKVDD